MGTDSKFNYQTVKKVIDLMMDNFKHQPSLEEIAEHLNLSPHDFEKIFIEWAGVSLKRFSQYLNINYGKQLLSKNNELNLFSSASNSKLSSASKLYNLPTKIEKVTPDEYKIGGQALRINYSFASSYFGEILIASTEKGICYLSFFEDRKVALELLKACFLLADFTERSDDLQQSAIEVLQNNFSNSRSIKLHLKGTDFQLKVWEALLNIPLGDLSTYGKIALEVGSPHAARAVGTAIGSNPIAFIIPCHRVIQNSGKLGGYMWGLERKRLILAWEAVKINNSR